MDDWINIQKDKKHIKREREKAKKLRKTSWWKNKLIEGICHFCKQKFEPDKLTMDHLIPVSRGGETNKRNVVPCCKDCNNKKKYLTPVDMILKKMKEEKKNG